MNPRVDLQSENGFRQAAKKKKAAKAAAKSKWADDDEDNGSKKEDGEGGDGGEKGTGDTGAGAGDNGGGDDDKKDELNGNGDGAEETKPEDDWDSFMPAKGKKKGKKNKVEDPPPVEEKFDAFHEIKLDDTAPMLDLNFDSGPAGNKSGTSGFGAWGSSWNTGTTR